MKEDLVLKRFIVIIIMLGFLIGITPKVNAQENQNKEINADAYVVIDSKTGEILLEKNKNKTHFPASITKNCYSDYCNRGAEFKRNSNNFSTCTKYGWK